ncbi:MAG: hypothetical protein AAGN46_00665, partial [Acidobacteriota bacterium]
MARQFFSGNTLELAVLAAARHFQIEPERLAYTERAKKQGFTGIRRKVVIEIDPEHAELAPEAIETTADSAGGERLSGTRISESPPRRAGKAAAAKDDDLAEDDAAEDEDDADEFDEADDPADDALDTDEDEVDEDEADEDEAADLDSDFEEGDDVGNRVDRGAAPDRRSGRGDGSKRGGKRSGGRGGRGRGGRGGRSRRGQSERPVATRHYQWEPLELDADGETSREAAAFEAALDLVLDVMDLEIEYGLEEGETFEVDLEGDDAELLTADDGRVLKAIEHI